MRCQAFILAAVVLGSASCDDIALLDDEGGVVVAEGKEDNFLSLKAQEYFVEGVATVTIESSLATATEAKKMARVRQLIAGKQVVIGWFLGQYLAEKESDAANASYGGFSALTKNGAYEELDIQAVDATTYRFTFRQEFGGKQDLLKVLPTTPGDDGRRYMDLVVGKISNEDMARLQTNGEWYRQSPWDSFDPKKVDASRLETMKLAVWAEPRSVDAWLDYSRLFADGRLTVAVHFGWDYHKEYHLVHSREVYDWLVGQGFASPVKSYDAYTRTSGPLAKDIVANGRKVRVEVSLFWGKPGTDTNPDTDAGGRVLEGDMRRSFKEREVVVYAGHSGPFYGFALGNWRETDEGDLDDAEIPSMDMPRDTYQVVLAEGCDTYSLGEAFRLNPVKAGAKDIDVLTTTSFSNAATSDGVKDFLTAVFGTDAAGNHKAATYLGLLGQLEGNSSWFNTMYGVHGLDDNPHRHPWAASENACKPCRVNADCGGDGNRCVTMGAEKICTFLCTADDGCPTGYGCRPVATGTTVTSYQCVPSNSTCAKTPPVPAGPAALLNEVFASPKEDANGDGAVSSRTDEFVEIMNVGAADLDLSGWSVSDSAMLRLKFAAGTKVGAGKALVVFGGGDPAKFGSLGGAVVRVAKSGLGLNDTGDSVTLKDAKGKVVDSLKYRAEGGRGSALVRSRDGDSTAPFIPHPDVPQSAGLKSDGTPF